MPNIFAVQEKYMKFDLGKLNTTEKINNKIKENKNFMDFLRECLNKHVKGDWGFIDYNDRKNNEKALINNSQIISKYSEERYPTIKIITKGDRSLTTILFSDEII